MEGKDQREKNPQEIKAEKFGNSGIVMNKAQWMEMCCQHFGVIFVLWLCVFRDHLLKAQTPKTPNLRALPLQLTFLSKNSKGLKD